MDNLHNIKSMYHCFIHVGHSIKIFPHGYQLSLKDKHTIWITLDGIKNVAMK